MEVGNRFIHSLIDHKSKHNAKEIFITYHESSSLEVLTTVDYETFGRAVDRMAFWLKDLLNDETSKTICYIGPSDIRYLLVLFGSSKNGSKVLFSSPRNTVEAHISLMEKAGCNILVGDSRRVPNALLETKKCVEMAPLRHWLDASEVPSFHCEKTYGEAANDILLYLHSSGSTGLPKLIPLPHSWFSAQDAYSLIPRQAGRKTLPDHMAGARFFLGVPLFHAAAICMIVVAIKGASAVIPPSDQPLSPGVLEGILDQRLADFGVTVPSLLEDISRSPSALEKIASWRFAIYGGSSLPKAAAEKVGQFTRVVCTCGSTEAGWFLSYIPTEPKDWEYMEYHPAMGIQYRPRDDNLAESIIVRVLNGTRYQGIFATFPQLGEYNMGDLYEQHPSNSHLWKIVGRDDDVLVLANGEKVIPNSMEEIMSTHPDVSAALVVGQQRFHLLLIIEPKGELSQDISNSEKVHRIWELVTAGNEQLPAYGKIDKEHILFLKPGQAFKRSVKGLVVRKMSILLLQDAIDEAYAQAENAACVALDFRTMSALEESLLDHIRGITDALSSLELEDDLFDFGVDSLQTLQLARGLRSALENETAQEKQDLSPALVYSHSTTKQLAAELFKRKYQDGANNMAHPVDHTPQMDAILNKYVAQFKGLKSVNAGKPPKFFTVILTGSTGSLGNHILHRLLHQPSVAKVICLNRSGDAEQRQQSSFKKRQLEGSLQPVEFLRADFSSPNLGLSASDYERLLKDTTHIIHNAWTVDFNRSITSLEPQIQGCYNLISLASAAQNRVQIFYISSISAVRRWASGAVPEVVINDLSASDTMGYGESKLVAELLFNEANKKLGVQCAICRVGQIAGPVERNSGSWNEKEWLPSLIKSSEYLGKLPRTLAASDSVDWIPVDMLGRIIVELLFSDKDKDETRVFHTVNPHRPTWSDIVPAVAKKLKNIKIVEYEEWLDVLIGSSEASHADIAKNPAVKLLDFYRSVQNSTAEPVFETMETVKTSKSLEDLPAVNAEWMGRWMQQWGWH